jgi:hypothetical protein
VWTSAESSYKESIPELGARVTGYNTVRALTKCIVRALQALLQLLLLQLLMLLLQLCCCIQCCCSVRHSVPAILSSFFFRR